MRVLPLSLGLRVVGAASILVVAGVVASCSAAGEGEEAPPAGSTGGAAQDDGGDGGSAGDGGSSGGSGGGSAGKGGSGGSTGGTGGSDGGAGGQTDGGDPDADDDAGDADLDASDDADDGADGAGDSGEDVDCTLLPEICDGLDNNCNGLKDEGDPGGGATCSTGLSGVCSEGTTHCTNGQIKCVQNQMPSVELCDGQDNNCDGNIDEGNPGSGADCDTGSFGLCKFGTLTCSGGSLSCQPLNQPKDEACNGLDDNCDGTVDEAPLPNVGTTCTVPGQPANTPCATSTSVCTAAGQIACPQTYFPLPEVCDGIDNDCAGGIDDKNVSGKSCNTGNSGVCSAGLTDCNNGVPACVQQTQPSSEKCDGLDNNCDGATDEGNPGGGLTCTTGQPGICGPGTTACTNGATACNQNQPPIAETCDGLDNDCDGAIDNGNPGGGQACNTGLLGVCAAGTTACEGGKVVCKQAVQASTEQCDGLDNDCDGSVDENNPGGGAACNTGQLGECALGSVQCAGGSLQCVRLSNPTSEICDNKDNDCDGTIDESNPGGGGSCNSGVPGVCSAGTFQCNGGTLACQQNVQPTTEICDGLDNNCNGSIDENNPGGGGACTTGLQGVCSAGIRNCVSGSLQCQQTTQSSTELCDNLDNDCNGVIDNSAYLACPSQVPTAGYVSTWGCSSGTCNIQSCVSGRFNLDNVTSNGCECALTAYSTACSTATGVTVARGATETRIGGIGACNGEAWFKVTYTAPAPGTYHDYWAELTGGAGEYVTDVFWGTSACTALNVMDCTVDGTDKGLNATTWHLDANYPWTDTGYSNNTSYTNTIYVRVRRVNPAATCTCSNFTVRFRNL